MIDVEKDVFDVVYQDITPLMDGGSFTSVFTPRVSKLPHATLMEIDNITDTKNRGTAADEEYAILTYEANVYSSDKQKCREIMSAIDESMVHLGFMRFSMQFIPNLADPKIFRYVARFQATADQNKTIYRKR